MASLGLAFFLLVGLMAFWLLLFLMGFMVPYWVTIGALHMLRPKRLTNNEDSNQAKH